MITTTATDIQNNFGKYLKAVQEGNEIIILYLCLLKRSRQIDFKRHRYFFFNRFSNWNSKKRL